MQDVPSGLSFRALIGFAPGRIEWTRFGLFVAAIFASDIVQLFVSYALGNPFQGVVREIAWFAVTALITALALALGFRSASGDGAAAVLTAISYALLSAGRDIMFSGLWGSLLYLVLIQRFFYFYIFVASFILFIRNVQSLLTALIGAALTATLLGLVVYAGFRSIVMGPAAFARILSPPFLVSNIVGAAALALLLWLLWSSRAEPAGAPLRMAAFVADPAISTLVRTDLLLRLEACAKAAHFLSTLSSCDRGHLVQVNTILAPVGIGFGGELQDLEREELRRELMVRLRDEINNSNEELRQQFGAPDTAQEVQRIFTRYGI